MWQRFTENARKVVFYAQEESQGLGATAVCTEQLLLGILRQSDSTAGVILTELGLSFETCRNRIIEKTPRYSNTSAVDMTLSPRAKRVIDLAFDEARGFHNDYIGTEHLLIALIREQDGIAGKTLLEYGIGLEKTRAKAQDVQLRQERPTQKSPANSRAQLHIRDEIIVEKVKSISAFATSNPDYVAYVAEIARLKDEVDGVLSLMQRNLLLGLCMEVEQGGSIHENENWKKLGLTKGQAKSLSEIGTQVHRLLSD